MKTTRSPVRPSPAAITPAESRLMQVLWDHGPLTSEEVIAFLPPAGAIHASTAKTLLNRLLNKGAVAAERDGRRYVYGPLVTREDYVARESRSLLDRLFDGRVSPLVSHFAERRALSKRDIAALRKLLEELDRG